MARKRSSQQKALLQRRPAAPAPGSSCAQRPSARSRMASQQQHALGSARGRDQHRHTREAQAPGKHRRAPHSHQYIRSEGARAVAMEYVVANCRAIQVGYNIDMRMCSGALRCLPGACTSRVSLCSFRARACREHGRQKSQRGAKVPGGAPGPGAAGVGSARQGILRLTCDAIVCRGTPGTRSPCYRRCRATSVLHSLMP